MVDISVRGAQYWHVTDPFPSDTYVRLVEQALSYDLGDPRGSEAMGVVLDRAMDEGLVLDLGSVQASETSRPSPTIRVTAEDMAKWHHRAETMAAQTFADLIEDLERAAAEVFETRHDLDSSFVAVRVGERGASIDVYWDDDGRRVASVFTGEGDVQTFTGPGRELGREVVRLLNEGAR